MLVENNAGTDIIYLKEGSVAGSLKCDVVSMTGGGDATASNQVTMINSLSTIEGDTTSLDSKITACNTGAVTVSSSVLPTGASSESTLSALNGKVTACDTGSVTVSSSALPTGASSESTLSALNGKVTACDTGSVTVSSSVLPTGASSESTLSSLDGKVSQGSSATISTAQQVLAYGRDQSGNLDALNVDAQGHLKITTNDIATDIPVTQLLSSQSVTSSFTSSAFTKQWRGSAKMGFEVKATNSGYTVEILGSNSNSNFFLLSSFFNTDSTDATLQFAEIDLPYKYFKVKISYAGTTTVDAWVSFS
jgi:hypothetical protein